MRRRQFLQSSAVLGPALALAQSGALRPDPVERMTAGSTPSIAVSQVGFRPEAIKQVVVRNREAPTFELEGPGLKRTFPLSVMRPDLETVAVGYFSDVVREGSYTIRVGDEVSPPFVIAADAWRRHLPKVVSYHRAQRCGVAVPGVHPVCHLDDARRRDNGQHIDTTGGWHDAGDLRKWMDATMMNAFGLLSVARNLGAKWDAAGSGLAPLEEELRWGNRYFLKMQGQDGQVWADVAGGVNGDNSDNHWTDNQVGTSDDRYLNPGKGGAVQGMFAALQAMYADHFRADPQYRERCLQAAKRCWGASKHDGETEELAWWILAAVELFRATNDVAYARAGTEMAGRLVALQQRGAHELAGYWLMSKEWNEPYKQPVHGALPAFVLLEAARTFSNGSGFSSAAKLYIEGYVEPLTARSAYGVMPFGVYKGSPTPEMYRKFDAEFTYRFFMPVKKQFWWLGLNGHIGSHALMLATAARLFNEKRWRDMSYRQLEWIFGSNPFCLSLASEIGGRTTSPFSPFVGVIPGGIMNGICGNENDEPVMDMRSRPTWRTNEYWSPHVGYFEWAQSVLEVS